MIHWIWLIAAAAAGIAGGWFLWGRSIQKSAADNSAPAAGQTPPAGTAEALEAALADLRSARAFIEAEAAETSETARRLDTLDTSIKRANGRLKLVMRAAKRAGEG